MHWLRSHARWGSALALLALICQLTLTFSHVHLEDAEQQHAIAALALEQPQSDVPPASDDRSGHQDRYCSACAILHLVPTVGTSEPPALPWPLVSGSDCFLPAQSYTHAGRREAHAQPRAPPTV
jgi:hypothetical protein